MIEQVRKKIARNISAENCAEMLEENLELVKKIYSLVKENPALDDKDICKLLQAKKSFENLISL